MYVVVSGFALVAGFAFPHFDEPSDDHNCVCCASVFSEPVLRCVEVLIDAF